MATLPTATRNAACNAVVDLIDAGPAAGKLIFRTSGDVAVATLTFSDPAFGNAATGVATASAITPDTNAAGGTITKATLEDSTGAIVMTVTANTTTGEIVLTSATIAATETVNCSALTVTMPAS